MNKKRLKELKKEVDELLRCPMSVWNGTGYEEVDELTETGKDLLAMIDAALAEPDADVAEAIGELEASLDEDFVVNGRINVFSTYQFKVETIDCIINKLRQYQKPTDEAVQRAIDWQEAEKESAQNDWERAGSEEIMKRFTKLLRIEYEDKWVVEDAFEDESGLIRGKAIDCLAQYETANEGLGCEECFGVAGMEIPLSTGIKSVNFCPICGRRF